MAITKLFKIIDPRSLEVNVADSIDYSGQGNLYGNYTWYHRLVNGSAQRSMRYREYDIMDADIDIARALDLVAEEIAGNNPKTETPLTIKLELAGGVKIQSKVVATLNAALKTWCAIHDWRTRIFYIARAMIKYGDCFFLRPENKNGKYIYCHPKNIISAAIRKNDITDISAWFIRNDFNTAEISPNLGQLYYNSGGIGNVNVERYDSDNVVRFTLNDDMSDEAPFGRSVLADVFRTFKQKQLLEDAIIIYRIQRAPEKKVFNIDVSRVHPHKVAQHLEQFRNEIKQKKIPTAQGGQGMVESIYDPLSMNEDYFVAKYKDGVGTTIDILPGGQNLGELDDLDYFFKKIWRGMRIPQSYIDSNAEGGTFNDGKVGIAYLQEVKFSLYVEKLQAHMEKTLDYEFKKFLRDSNIKVDESVFKVVLPSPSNYDVSRRQAMDSELLNNYINADGIESLSKRFALKKYAGLTEEEIITNERMKREELGLNPDGDYRDLPQIYAPDAAEAGGYEGGLGGFSGGPTGVPTASFDDEEDFDLDMGDDDSLDDEESPIDAESPTIDATQPTEEK